MHKYQRLIPVCVLILGLVGCGPRVSPPATPTPWPTYTPYPSYTLQPTYTIIAGRTQVGIPLLGAAATAAALRAPYPGTATLELVITAALQGAPYPGTATLEAAITAAALRAPYPGTATPGPVITAGALGAPYPGAATSGTKLTQAETTRAAVTSAASPSPTSKPSATPSPTVGATATPRPIWTPYPAPLTEDGKTSNIGPYLLANPEAGQPTHNLLKDGAMRGYLAINPAHWTPYDQLPHMEGYGRNWIPTEEELALIRDGAAGARAYYDQFEQTYESTRGDIHAWMSTWGFVYGDAAFAERWVEFQMEWVRLMHDHGYRAGVGGMKTHLFKPGEIAWLAPAIAQADYLFLSESGAPTLVASMGKTTLLYRALMAELDDALSADRIPALILDISVDGRVLVDLDQPGGPWWQRGYRDFETSQADYLADVRAYDLETLRDPYVRHVFWFATNITRDTRSFDVNTDMLAVANGWHSAASSP